MNIKSMIKEIETEIQKKDWEIIRMRSAINELKKIGEIQETHPNQYSENKKKDKHKLKERGMISWNDEIKENNELREKIYDEEGIFYNVYKIEDFMDDNSLIREEEDE